MKRLVKIIGIIANMVLIAAIVYGGYLKVTEMTERYFTLRGHGDVSTECYTFTESSRQLNNPYRGFYHMHGFRILDEKTEFRDNVAARFCKDEDTALTMIQVNLQAFREGAISRQGLENLEALFAALSKVDKHLIVRFLYDWEGKNEEYEPDTLEVILEHIGQSEQVLRKYSDEIYILQGLFIGNWGEMHGTKFLGQENFQALANKLFQVTDEKTYLAVRMPAQWRVTTQLGEPEKVVRGDGSLASRLSLFNDGMLGSWSDYGTYGERTKEEYGPFTYWNREQELEFQDTLCKIVPIGGEVVVDNEYNDFENAVKDMATMHVSYINRDYDGAVMKKWENTIVEEDGCFNGMDGLSYIERHLGYRFVLRDVSMDYDFKQDTLQVAANMQNVGFAPLYREADIRMIFYNEEADTYYSVPVNQDIRDLTGGNDRDDLLTLSAELKLTGETEGSWLCFLDIRDKISGQRILLGNEQDATELGYCVGGFTLESAEKWLTEWKAQHKWWEVGLYE